MSDYWKRVEMEAAEFSNQLKWEMLECLSILFSNVWNFEYGGSYYSYQGWTAKTAREVWKDEGKDEEGRRKWERRWREAGDIMNEEDVMEASIMHLCIPSIQDNGCIIPSEWSWTALGIVMNEELNKENAYHFPLFDLSKQPENVVIIRNIPSDYYWNIVEHIKSKLESICHIVSTEEAISSNWNYRDYNYGAMKVTLETSEDAMNVVKDFDGCRYDHFYLTARMNMRDISDCDSIRPLLSLTPPSQHKFTISWLCGAAYGSIIRIMELL